MKKSLLIVTFWSCWCHIVLIEAGKPTNDPQPLCLSNRPRGNGSGRSSAFAKPWTTRRDIVQTDRTCTRLWNHALRERFPQSTPQERKRFSIAHPKVKAASKKLQFYLEWREQHSLIENQLLEDVEGNVLGGDDASLDCWDRCVRVARVSSQDLDRADTPLPHMARMYRHPTTTKSSNDVKDQFVCDLSGKRLLHVMPAQMDATSAKSSTYALAFALYIEQLLNCQDLEKITVVLDVRGGHGWPNVMPHLQLPFIKKASTLLLRLFPERCHACILYPMPPSATWIWNIAKIWLDPKTASKMKLLVGPAKIVSPPPMEQMQELVSKETIQLLEDERQAAFVEERVNA